MAESREIPRQECERLLRDGVVGRVALSTPDGPHILPVAYTVFAETVVVPTSSYSMLGSYGPGAMLAFEIDQVDDRRDVRWSVHVRGRAWAETDPGELARIRAADPTPWPLRTGRVCLRIPWSTLAGRFQDAAAPRIDESAVPHALTAL